MFRLHTGLPRGQTGELSTGFNHTRENHSHIPLPHYTCNQYSMNKHYVTGNRMENMYTRKEDLSSLTIGYTKLSDNHVATIIKLLQHFCSVPRLFWERLLS